MSTVYVCNARHNTPHLACPETSSIVRFHNLLDVGFTCEPRNNEPRSSDKNGVCTQAFSVPQRAYESYIPFCSEDKYLNNPTKTARWRTRPTRCTNNNRQGTGSRVLHGKQHTTGSLQRLEVTECRRQQVSVLATHIGEARLQLPTALSKAHATPRFQWVFFKKFGIYRVLDKPPRLSTFVSYTARGALAAGS